ncbi:hypothetical protein QJS04_geneDACA002455 [Acorus gramineus]|uniref:DUF4283 domain-containing protein n=1 Tax=Acorus gramineus TaxID=55184 RepID=A0AAV9A1V7_ACOGR|nr:hypothetical protein QJS04_geneDACA002455 [Acorus gramineus]
MAGRPIVLRRWNRGMRLEIERLETIPLWIRFPALPLHMWGNRLISKLASAIGKPLYMDTATTNRSRVEFARVCIEVSTQTELQIQYYAERILYGKKSMLNMNGNLHLVPNAVHLDIMKLSVPPQETPF